MIAKYSSYYINKFINIIYNVKYMSTQKEKDLIQENETLKETVKLIIQKTFMPIFNQLNTIKWFLGVIEPETLKKMEDEIKGFPNQLIDLDTKFNDYTSKISNYVNNIVDYFNQNNELIKKQLINLENNYSKLSEQCNNIENNTEKQIDQYEVLDSQIKTSMDDNKNLYSKLSEELKGVKIILSSLNEQSSSIITDLYLLKAEQGPQKETITRDRGDYKIPIFKTPSYKELPEREINQEAVIGSLLKFKVLLDDKNVIGLDLSKLINETINTLTNNLTPRGKLNEFLRPLNADVRRYLNDVLPKGYTDLIEEEIDKIIEFYKSIKVIKEY